MAKYEELLAKYNMSPKEASQKSKTWFEQQITLLNREKIQPNVFLRTNPALTVKTKVLPGSMYMFKYDPKYAESLDYYDMFPLIFPFAVQNNGFKALNMHYLHPMIRAKTLDALTLVINNKKYDETTRFRMTWATINSISKLKQCHAAVKHYLIAHLDSQIKIVNPNDWVATLLLPLEGFIGANKRQVWKDSYKV